MQTKSKTRLLKSISNMIGKLEKLEAFNDGMKQIWAKGLNEEQHKKAVRKLQRDLNYRPSISVYGKRIYL